MTIDRDARRRYAARTKVPVDRTKTEIERLVSNRGADQYVSGQQMQPPRALVQFHLHDRIVRFELPLPPSRSGRESDRDRQEMRSRWRALFLIVKAKLEAVDSGITTFEEEFLAHIVMPGDRTIAQLVLPQVRQAYKTGKLPELLPRALIEGEVSNRP
jgi:hypothetical protein